MIGPVVLLKKAETKYERKKDRKKDRKNGRKEGGKTACILLHMYLSGKLSTRISESLSHVVCRGCNRPVPRMLCFFAAIFSTKRFLKVKQHKKTTSRLNC